MPEVNWEEQAEKSEYSFVWLSDTPLYSYATSSLPLPLLMDIQAASLSWLL